MKLIVSDLDGTLLNEKSEISPVTRDTLRKLSEKGILFAFASGRSIDSVKVFRDFLGIEAYFICNNGASIYDSKENPIFESYMDSNITEKLLEFFRENKINYNGFSHKNIFIEDSDYSKIVTLENHFIPVKLSSKTSAPEMTKLIVKGEPDFILDLKDKMSELFGNVLDLTISHPRCLDFVSISATKGKGIKFLSEKLGIPLSSVIAFGDGENDYDMLKTAGHSVVMENALESMKEKIKNTAPSNTRDGVAIYLQDLFNCYF